jgi:high affinity Mn2+ porin
MRRSLATLTASLLLAPPALARAQADTGAAQPIARKESWYQNFYDTYPWFPQLLGGQFTFIWQDLPPFHSPYSGRQSLIATGDAEFTHTYGLYLGAKLTPAVQLYVDFEDARGQGIGHAYGLAGITNGDVIREGSVNLGQDPYLARAYMRFLIPIGSGRDTADRGMDQIPGPEPSTRVEIKAGKFALNDDFDQNRYANTTRYQFMDWSLWNNTAWDFAADTRGYTNGLEAAFVSPIWSLRVAAAQMSTFANGNIFDGDIPHAYALNAELTVHPDTTGTVLRFLAYENHARMGIYRDAINIAIARDTTPCISCDDAKGRIKYGFGFNVEQPLADSGNTGVFVRLGWNDGKTEDFEFAEVDRLLSGGIQLAGNMWHRPTDRFGLGAAMEGLSEDHEQYLAMGGYGFMIGDGKIHYATENVVEAYYRFQPPVLDFVQITPAIQHIDHPAYNEDRGPLYVYTIRVNMHY